MRNLFYHQRKLGRYRKVLLLQYWSDWLWLTKLLLRERRFSRTKLLLDLNYPLDYDLLCLKQNPQQNAQAQQRDGPRDSIYIGKKPLMAYVTSTLIQLANQPSVTIKARGLSIGRAVDVSQIILKRMENAGYKIGDVRIGSETVQAEDGRTRNVSTIEIEVKKV